MANRPFTCIILGFAFLFALWFGLTLTRFLNEVRYDLFDQGCQTRRHVTVCQDQQD